MSELVANCPRCGAKAMTFDLMGQIHTSVSYGWQHWFEAFCVCRNCNKSTTFVLAQKEINAENEIRKGLSKLDRAVNQVMRIEGYISLKDTTSSKPASIKLKASISPSTLSHCLEVLIESRL